MSSPDRPIYIATRGSALALAQSKMILAECQAAFPQRQFEIKIIKTTGDKLQALPATDPIPAAGKGLFTKELEVALLQGDADLAVHSLKDLPTELPEGLILAAVSRREDVRDVFIYRAEAAAGSGASREPGGGAPPLVLRGLKPHATIRDLPRGATVATSSTRRQAQLLALRSDLKVIPMRGNVGTRLRKLAENPELDGLVLAAAGLNRLRFSIAADGSLSSGDPGQSSTGVPPGLLASPLSTDEMLPCVGQGAIGLETRKNDDRMAAICERLNDARTFQCVVAERAFLHAMGGGCLSPVGAYAEILGDQLCMRVVSFREEKVRRSEARGNLNDPAALGARLAEELMA